MTPKLARKIRSEAPVQRGSAVLQNLFAPLSFTGSIWISAIEDARAGQQKAKAKPTNGERKIV